MDELTFAMRVAELLGADPSQVKPETRLDSIAGYDSIGKLSIMAFFDEELQRELQPASFRALITIADLHRLGTKP